MSATSAEREDILVGLPMLGLGVGLLAHMALIVC